MDGPRSLGHRKDTRNKKTFDMLWPPDAWTTLPNVDK
jgi:hypothetical protein